jgi:hypothetical protein
MEALECKIANWFDGHGIFDRHHDPRTNQDLSGLGFIAKPRCDIGYRSDGGIIETSLKANGAERRESVRYTDAKTNLMPQPMPFLNQRANRRTHFKCHPHGLQGRVMSLLRQSPHGSHAGDGVMVVFNDPIPVLTTALPTRKFSRAVP